MPKITDDVRIAYCPCGWGQGQNKTAIAVNGHQSHRRSALCLEKMIYVDEPAEATTSPAAPADEPDPIDDEDESEASDAADATARSTNGAGPTVQQLDPQPRGGKRGPGGLARNDQQHYGGYTPIRGTFTFPALLHAYYDWFCDPKRGDVAYDGDFQTWVADLVLDCLTEHWGLEFGVVIRPRVQTTAASVAAGGSNGHR